MEGDDARDFAFIRKFIYTVADADGDVPFPEATRQAMQNWEQQQEHVAQLQAVVETDLDVLDYEQMTKKDRVRVLQQHIHDEATGTANGKAKMDYKDVKWLFNNEPSPGYCYELMRLAGEEQGFNYREFGEGRSNRLEVETAAVKAASSFHTVNKGTTSEGD